MTATILRLIMAAWRPLAAILGALGIYAKGRADANGKAAMKDAKEYRETRKRVDEAETVGNDPDAARRWLHERGKSGGGL